jgi:glycylpeptide N-tetradecanoyltransferase
LQGVLHITKKEKLKHNSKKMSAGENQDQPAAAAPADGSDNSTAVTAAQQQQLQALLERLNVAAAGGAAGADAAAQQQQQQLQRAARDKTARKERYAFWETQPVVQFDAAGSAPQEDGPIDAPKTVADVRPDPYPLPPAFEWGECDVSDAAQVREVFELLHANYVEDDDAMFRFSYSPAFLQWALQPPGFRRDWHVGVRVKASGKLVAFISAIPAEIVAAGRRLPMVEINFLCVHKRLRSKRLAPVLIKVRARWVGCGVLGG